MYTDLILPPDSFVLTEIARMPLEQRAIALSSAAYAPTQFAAQLVASVANVPVWGASAQKQFDRFRAQAEKAPRQRSRKMPSAHHRPVTTGNLFLLFPPGEADQGGTSVPAVSSDETN